MSIKEWKYYNHAAIPAMEPREIPDTTCLKNGSIWKIKDGTPILARWTTDFDCDFETNWWYVIKDTPFDIAKLKSKRRYEINKGKKNFDVRRIKASDYMNELIKVHLEAISSWPKKYRPNIQKETLKKEVLKWNKDIVYGGFDRETSELCIYERNTNIIWNLAC